MFDIRLLHQNGYAWSDDGRVFVKGFLFDEKDELLRGEPLRSFFADCSTREQLAQRLETANGMFSVIIKNEDELLVAVDRLRCFPLFYRWKEDSLRVSDEVDALFDDQEPKCWNNEARAMFALSGYTTGDETLVAGIHQLQAGEMVSFQKGRTTRDFYFSFAAKPYKAGFEEAKQQLKALLYNVGERMVACLKGRPVAVPLSGGLDSRLLVYLLHKNGCQNVTCFTYGKKAGNDEWQRSEKVARHFGYSWEFIDYEQVDVSHLLEDEQFLSYCRYASQYSSKFYFSEYFAAKYHTEQAGFEKDTVFMPGHSGDMLAGSHLRSYMNDYRNLNQVCNDLIYNHFNLIEANHEERKVIRRKLKEQLKEMWGQQLSYSRLYELWDLRERQAKYIVNSCKLWEFFGCEYLLPLWDAELTDFFASLPFEYRFCKKLYEELLWEMFQEEGILFEEDHWMRLTSGWKEELKLMVKRAMPFIHTPKLLVDNFDFQRLTEPMRQVLNNAACKCNVLNYNAIINEWYLQWIEMDLQEQRAVDKACFH